MLDKLEAIKDRFEEVAQLIIQPDVMSDMGNYTKLSKEYKDLEKVVTAYDSYRLTLDNINSTKAILEKRERSGIPGDG